jgi:sugar/nucleoside kinase (ribokinase family)
MEPQRAPIEYLLIGHLSRDLTPQGHTLGGSVAYASRTLAAMGVAVGVVTSCAAEEDLSPLTGIDLVCREADETTTFENRYRAHGRSQRLLGRARPLGVDDIPTSWEKPPLVHLAPIADEVDPYLAKTFPAALRVATPQGWLRRWDESGLVSPKPWRILLEILPDLHAAALSIEDLGGDEEALEQLAGACPLLAVTRGAQGATIFWHGQRRDLPAPQVQQVDPTGAGDIFAAVLFRGLQEGLDPYQAARGAIALAARSVNRHGLEGTPSPAEIQASLAGVGP